jgi:hypothetical protein
MQTQLFKAFEGLAHPQGYEKREGDSVPSQIILKRIGTNANTTFQGFEGDFF